MKITEHLKRAKKTLFSFEIIPPLKGENVESIYECIDPLIEFNPSFIDVTYHRQEYVYKQKGNGLLEKKAIRKRPGTVGMCAAIMHKYEVDAVPHIICGGFTREETENALIDLNFLGIENVLVLRGDPIKNEPFIPEPDGHAYATDLIKQVVNLNNGVYLDEEIQNTKPTDFCIGVAGYPEKHFEAPNPTSDLKFLKMKQDLGAEYIVTQMFFDNEKYFEWVKKCRDFGITIPIIPGLKPLTTKRQLTLLPSIFHIDIPEDLAEAVRNTNDPKVIQRIGIEWSIQQSKELIANNVPCLHFYSMGKSFAVREIMKGIM